VEYESAPHYNVSRYCQGTNFWFLTFDEFSPDTRLASQTAAKGVVAIAYETLLLQNLFPKMDFFHRQWCILRQITAIVQQDSIRQITQEAQHCTGTARLNVT